MNSLATEAIVLSRIEYGEADRIMTLLTSTHGKLSVLAKGVRRPKSKLAGGIELFSVSQIMFINGRSDLKTLVSAHLKTNYGNIVKDINRTMTAYDFLKYINQYTEVDCEEDYFDLLQHALSALNDVDLPLGITRVWYAVRLLLLSGHGINLESDAAGVRLQANDRFGFDYHDMAFTTHTSGDFSSNHIKFLRLAQILLPKQLLKIQDAAQLADQLGQVAAECTKYYSR
jgi:DNA repair protein RecO